MYLKNALNFGPKMWSILKVLFPEIEQVASGKTKGAVRSWLGELGVNVLDIRGCRGIDVGDLGGGRPGTKLRNRIDDWLGADGSGESSLQLRAGGHARTGEGRVVNDASPFLGEKEESFSCTAGGR